MIKRIISIIKQNKTAFSLLVFASFQCIFWLLDGIEKWIFVVVFLLLTLTIGVVWISWLVWLSKKPRPIKRIIRIIIFVTVALVVLKATWMILSGQWKVVFVLALIPSAAIVAAIWWLWWLLPKRQMLSVTTMDPKERADIEDNFRKTVGQALGGVAFLIGAVFTYLQFTQQQQSAEDFRISNQLSKAFEQLSGEKTEMRLGGIYALEGVMKSSSEYSESVLDALCAFVRDHTKGEVSVKQPATDVQAALSVIGRRSRDVIAFPDLDGAKIPGAQLNGAYLNAANMRNTDISNGNLDGAQLYNVNLEGADLSHVNFGWTNLERADLSNAKLVGVSLFGVTLKDADMSGADLSGANLSLAMLGESKGLVQEQLDGACGRPLTLPPNLRAPEKDCKP